MYQDLVSAFHISLLHAPGAPLKLSHDEILGWESCGHINAAGVTRRKAHNVAFTPLVPVTIHILKRLHACHRVQASTLSAGQLGEF
jgi:hypothetical protein